jgi:serine protease
MTVADNVVVDTDVNDPNIEEIPNDPGDGLPEQQLFPPARVAGFVTEKPTGTDGERFELEADEYDSYVLSLREGEGVQLTISDWDPRDKDAVDLDLYLSDVNSPEEFADSSVTVEEVETVIAPYSGNYFVRVHAVSGQSNYLLESGLMEAESSGNLDVTSSFVEDQVMAAVWDSQTLLSETEARDYRNQIEKIEQKFSLTRIAENAAGEVLYEIDSSSFLDLVPHPLGLAGFGSVTPEQWRVIRIAKKLQANPDYRWAGPNYIYQKSEVPNDSYYGFQWHYDQIRLPEAWDITRGSEEVTVAVIDTGVWPHSDLAQNVNSALGYDFVSSILNSGDGDGIDSDASDPGDPFPLFNPYWSHGTHVAGTIGASTNNGAGVAGVNWNIEIMPVRVLGISGGTCSDINQGLRWAGRLANDSGRTPSKQADVINLSLGGSSACPGTQDIIDQLTNRGVIVIAAAGNEGTSIRRYPASLNHVVSVSATTIADELAYYSSYGTTVDIAAPGGDRSKDLNNDSYVDGVLSPTFLIEEGSNSKQSIYYFAQGTSMASPHVAGVVALMKSVFPNMRPSDLDTAIASGEITADLAQNGETSKDSQFGYGRIDALEAVNWAVSAEQGRQTDAFMTSSSAALDFGSDAQSEYVRIEKAGDGNLRITDYGRTESWISVSAQSVDADGFGTYRVTLDRDGLPEGQYSGWLAFDASNGSRLWISVLMRVGEFAPGEAGYVYALLLDQWTLGNVKYWQGPQLSNGFDIELKDLPPGRYYLLVSTDLDKDYIVCDDGELCELYPSNSTISPIDIVNQDVELGRFRLGFPVPDLKSQAASNAPITGLESRIPIRLVIPALKDVRIPE